MLGCCNPCPPGREFHPYGTGGATTFEIEAEDFDLCPVTIPCVMTFGVGPAGIGSRLAVGRWTATVRITNPTRLITAPGRFSFLDPTDLVPDSGGVCLIGGSIMNPVPVGTTFSLNIEETQFTFELNQCLHPAVYYIAIGTPRAISSSQVPQIINVSGRLLPQ
jgi:hypothetical protein